MRRPRWSMKTSKSALGLGACTVCLVVIAAWKVLTLRAIQSGHGVEFAIQRSIDRSRMMRVLCASVRCANATTLARDMTDALASIPLSVVVQREGADENDNHSEILRMVLSDSAGETCEETCLRGEMSCIERGFSAINSCSKLRLATGCELCSRMADSTNMGLPGIVSHDLLERRRREPAEKQLLPSFFNGRCLIRSDQNVIGSSPENPWPSRCSMSGAELQRLCPCAP